MSELVKVYNDLGMTRTRRSSNEVRVYTTHCELDLYKGRRLPGVVTCYAYDVVATALFDAVFLDAVRALKWFLSNSGYAVSQTTHGIMFLHHIMLPKSELEVDHIDTNPLNCCSINLRYATHSQNKQNSAINFGSTAYKGVSIDRTTRANKKYRTYIQTNGVKYWGPRFYTPEEANQWIRAKREQLHGEFANHGDKQLNNTNSA